MSDFKIVLTPSGQTLEGKSDKTLLEQLREAGVYVKSSCGGHATCRDCVVKVTTGSDQLTPPTFEEMRLLGNVFHITKERLACQTKITGTVTLDISAHDKSRDQDQLMNKTSKMNPRRAPKVIRKSAEDREREQASREEGAAEAGPEEEKKFPQGGFRRPKGLSYPKPNIKKKPGRY